MAYGNSPLIGSTIDPRLFQQDFSGYADAAKTNAMGILSIGSMAGDYLKQQGERKNALKSSQAQIEAAATLFPDQAPYLQGISAQLKDEDTPLSQRAALASQVGELINMGVSQQRSAAEMAMRERQLGMQERESGMHMQQMGQQLAAGDAALQQQKLDEKTQSTLGPELLRQTLAISDPNVAKSVEAKIGSYTPAEQFKLANSLAGLLPKADDREPVVKDFDTPDGGKLQLQLDRKSGTWQPIPVTPDTTAFIANMEGFNGNAYSDSGQTSIGYGTRAKPGEKTITKAEAEKRLKEELATHAERVDAAAKANGLQLNDNQRTALISFDFNTGAGADVISRFAKDPTKLTAKMAEYRKLDKNDAEPSQGLMNRRAAEIGLFQSPVVGFKHATVDEKDQVAIDKGKREIAKMDQDAASTAQKASGAVDQSQQFLTKLGELEKHPGFPNLFGSNIGIPTWVAGSSGADAKAMFESIQGTGFLEAVQSLKGMGALTEAEGQKATASFLGLSTSMSEEAAKKRLRELRDVVAKGIEKAKSSQASSVTTPAAATAPAIDPFTAATNRLRGFVTQ